MNFFTLAGSILVASFGVAAMDESPLIEADGPASTEEVGLYALPAGTVFQRVVVGTGDSVVADTAGGERLVYSNPLGNVVVAVPAGALVSDDITANAPDGCRLTGYEFQVVGKANPAGTGGPYGLSFALYSS